MRKIYKILMLFTMTMLLTAGYTIPAMAAATEHTISVTREAFGDAVPGYPEPTFIVPEKAKAGDTITIKDAEFPYKVLTIVVSAKDDGEFLFTADSLSFTMPDEDINMNIVWMPVDDPENLILHSVKLCDNIPKIDCMPGLVYSVDKAQAKKGETVTVTVEDTESAYTTPNLSMLEIYDTEGNLLTTKKQEMYPDKDNVLSFEMPASDVEIMPEISYTAPLPTPYSVKIDNPWPMKGVYISADTQWESDVKIAFEGNEIQVSYTCTTPESQKYGVAINRLYVCTEDGKELFSVAGNKFEMPDCNVIIKADVGIVGEPIALYKVKITNADSINGVRFETEKAGGGYAPGNMVKIVCTKTEADFDLSRVKIEGLEVYATKGTLMMFASEGDRFLMPDESVNVRVIATVAPAPGFKDVNASTPHYKAIIWAKDTGVAKGYSDGTFRPSKTSSRGDMVMFIWNMMGKPEPKAVSASPFKDVAKTHKYYKAILWASQKGITKGYSDGTFKPDRAVTRGEAVHFLWNMKGRPKLKSTYNPFQDLTKADAHYNAILWAYQNGITKGYSDKTFRSDNNATRGEIVEFLYRTTNG